MDPNEIERSKQLIDDNCNQILNILEDLGNGPPENEQIVHILGPMMEKLTELKDNLFSCIDNPGLTEDLNISDKPSDQ